MIEIKLAQKIVYETLYNGKDYTKAVDEVFPGEFKQFQSSNISVLLAKQALKKYFLTENIINENNIKLTNNERCFLFVILANIFYSKVLSKNNCISYLKGEIPEEEFLKIEPILTKKESLEDLISFDKDSNFYFATKYNVPIWLVHMWRKQYGNQIAEDFMKSSLTYNLQSYMVNTLKTSTDALLQKYPDFKSPFEDMLLFSGTTRYQVTDSFKNDEYIDVKIGFKQLIDEIYDPYKEMLLYSGYDDDFAKAVMIKSNGKQGINLVVPNLESRPELLRFIRVNGLRNINLFEANDSIGLKAGVSYKQDLVVVFPKSTRFDIASKYPDFLLHFDRDDLDGIIEGEMNALELCSNNVDDGGTLVYVVNTLNTKETTKMIAAFLEKHPEFDLDKDEQLLSSHPFATTMYCAFLTRRSENND